MRRVKTETARIELKDGRPVEGSPQLVEVTTYGIKGNRIENTSYPIGGWLVGKEEYKYDKRGNITEMTVRDERGAIVSREAYSYEFDKFGNWTKMVTSLVVFENGELKREPIEVTYRTVTYYFDDTVAKIVESPRAVAPNAKPAAAPQPLPVIGSVLFLKEPSLKTRINGKVLEPPPSMAKIAKVESAFAVARLRNFAAEPPLYSNRAESAKPVQKNRSQFDADDWPRYLNPSSEPESRSLLAWATRI